MLALHSLKELFMKLMGLILSAIFAISVSYGDEGGMDNFGDDSGMDNYGSEGGMDNFGDDSGMDNYGEGDSGGAT